MRCRKPILQHSYSPRNKSESESIQASPSPSISPASPASPSDGSPTLPSPLFAKLVGAPNPLLVVPFPEGRITFPVPVAFALVVVALALAKGSQAERYCSYVRDAAER
ncbi:hypothetical protein CALVIDRAFT_536523 [Calocera viscosa TUFC12733]|uniref:Uncharacterized protein n=1 Tax=Calocera viscosa (strain TUFC12733) TaxID=1330018 RepID=A0A167MTT4_CALVF|nr:hypothetical protein CALVIDRAFT_536523 [Calocera viscosa TUFC12733]